MERLTKMVMAILLATSYLAVADEKTSKPMGHSAMAKPAQLSIPVAAKEAVAAVDRFNSALQAGKLDKAGAELDTNILIFESGYVERSAAEYLGDHAKGDAAFLKGAHVQLIQRSAQASGDVAWVVTESELHRMKDGKMSTSVNTETMLLKRIDKAWKIVHIHWSSHSKK